jgi:hypothetical protein
MKMTKVSARACEERAEKLYPTANENEKFEVAIIIGKLANDGFTIDEIEKAEIEKWKEHE